MNTMHRLEKKFDFTGKTSIDLATGRAGIQHSPRHLVTGLEVAQWIMKIEEEAKRGLELAAKLRLLLDEGETADEMDKRLEWEKNNPEAFARKNGWLRIEEFAALCNDGPTGFRKRIKDCKGQVVFVRDLATKERLLHGTWAEYPGRHEYWGDWFHFAEDWQEAADRVRKGMKA